MEFIENIKKLCKENGISLHALEQKLGYGQGSLARSQTIKADRLKEIADYFGVTMDEVYSGNGSVDYKIGDPGQDCLIEYCSNDKQAERLLSYIVERPELQMLLFMTKDMSKSDLQKVTAIAQVMKDNKNV